MLKGVFLVRRDPEAPFSGLMRNMPLDPEGKKKDISRDREGRKAPPAHHGKYHRTYPCA